MQEKCGKASMCWGLNVAFWVDGVWLRLVPRSGSLASTADKAAFVVWNGTT